MQNCSVKLILVIKLWLIEYRVCYTFFILAIPVIFVFFLRFWNANNFLNVYVNFHDSEFVVHLYDSFKVKDTHKWAIVHSRIKLFINWGTATTFIIIIYILHIQYDLTVFKYIPIVLSLKENLSR